MMRRPSPAMVIACLSLFIGLSGIGTAAGLALKRNQVKSIHIGNGQVKRADLATGAVSAAKVADGSLLALDFAAGQVPTGPRGLQGVQGLPGATAAVVSDEQDPPALSGQSALVENMAIETTTRTDLFLAAEAAAAFDWTVDCNSSGPCSVTVGLYVDEAPVPGTARTLSAAASGSAAAPAILLYGIAHDVPAGPHLVEIWETPIGGAGLQMPIPQIKVIALG